MKSAQPDHFNEPWMEWCEKCGDYVISLSGHCINNDTHRTYSLAPHERPDFAASQQSNEKKEESLALPDTNNL